MVAFEWGADFSTRDVGMRRVTRFEAHAMIELGNSIDPRDAPLQFNARKVLRTLKR